MIFKKANILEGITKFSDNFFDCIIHAPPTFKLAPQLCSIDFYRKLYRTLKSKGKLYHYSPLLQRSKNKVFLKLLRGTLKGQDSKV